jgi:hypothetical protein
LVPRLGGLSLLLVACDEERGSDHRIREATARHWYERFDAAMEACRFALMPLMNSRHNTENLMCHASNKSNAAVCPRLVAARECFNVQGLVFNTDGFHKAGSFCRSERMAKWNELLRIQRELGARAIHRHPGSINEF